MIQSIRYTHCVCRVMYIDHVHVHVQCTCMYMHVHVCIIYCIWYIHVQMYTQTCTNSSAGSSIVRAVN